MKVSIGLRTAGISLPILRGLQHVLTTLYALAIARASTSSVVRSPSPSPISDLLFIEKDGPDLLFMGPTTECVCGNNVMHALVWFNDEREIGGYFTEMACAFCGALLRGATPIDQEVLPND